MSQPLKLLVNLQDVVSGAGQRFLAHIRTAFLHDIADFHAVTTGLPGPPDFLDQLADLDFDLVQVELFADDRTQRLALTQLLSLR